MIEQKMINRRNAIQGVACSHVRACYPQSLPQFPGASGNAQSRAAQGFAGEIESFLLDPEAADVRDMAFCTTKRSTQ
jgi:hypothetical protein